MASERSFHDRYGRAQRLSEAIRQMPGYQPSESSITVSVYDIFLSQVGSVNEEIGGLQEEYNSAVNERKHLFFSEEGIKKRASSINDYCKSLSGISSTLPTIQRLISKINNTRRPASNKTPEAGDGKRRNSGEQSYAELTQYMGELIGVLNKISDKYTPNNPLITLDNLKDFLATVKEKNKLVAEKEYALSKKSKDRNDLYEGDEGLQKRMAAIRAYIRGDFGRESSEYLSIRELKY
jgi:hypothetical protein